MRLRINENMVWTDSQDYGADEILSFHLPKPHPYNAQLARYILKGPFKNQQKSFN